MTAAAPPKVLHSLLSARLELLECRPAREEGRPPLLFVHGAYSAAWTWSEHFLPHFAANGYRAYAVSLRGHGGSRGRKALTSHSLGDYVDDLAETIEAIGAPPVVIGHSMGAMVAMKYLERSHLPAVAFLAPVPPQGLFAPSLNLALTRPGLFGELHGLLATGRASPEAMHQALFAGPLPPERLLDYYARFQRESTRALWDMTLFDLPRGWRMRRPPMLVLLASHDSLFPLEHSRAGFAALGVETEVLEPMGHAMMLEAQWRRPADRLLGWLDGMHAAQNGADDGAA